MSKTPLDKQSRLLLFINGLFVLAGALSGTFLNVFLWKSKQDFAMIGWFTISQQIGLVLTFWLAGKWVKEHNKMNALRLGILLSGVFYLLVLGLDQHAVSYIWPLGLLLGASLGLFWLAFNVVYFEVTDRDNRDLFNGWVGLIGSFVGIVGPWISGMIISISVANQGYQYIFMISMLVFGIGVVFSFFLKKRKTEGTYNWNEPVKQLSERGNPWRWAGPALAAQGIREGVFSFLVNLLVYITTTQEAKLGQFYLITSFVALVSYHVIGKWYKPAYRYYGTLVGAALLFIFTLPLLWTVNYGTLLLQGVGSAIFMPLYILPMISSVFDLMGTSGENVSKRVELVVLREICLTIGRVVGIVIFIIVLEINQSTQTITWLMIILGLSPVLSWFMIRRLLQAQPVNNSPAK
ncbi:MFS transporter [Paenibacillus urinalis]|uniref:MFS transporter n=1 Tax=Paenibacillus urinalis TaxID=521520 RepID=UPI0019620E14|nr:MFS transporter [Paenibacillus urinalis]WDH95612.1 MFS transporter [Paenibacillus urinalis]